jgi:hypothetical protein
MRLVSCELSGSGSSDTYPFLPACGELLIFGTNQQFAIHTSENPPGTIDVLIKTAGVPIDRYSPEMVEQRRSSDGAKVARFSLPRSISFDGTGSRVRPCSHRADARLPPGENPSRRQPRDWSICQPAQRVRCRPRPLLALLRFC